MTKWPLALLVIAVSACTPPQSPGVQRPVPPHAASAPAASSTPGVASALPPAIAEPKLEPCPAFAASPAADGPLPRQVLQARHTAEVRELAFSPSGRLVSIGDDFTLRLWSLQDRALLRVVRLATMPHRFGAAWDASGDHVSLVTTDFVRTFRMTDGSASEEKIKLTFPAGAKPGNAFDVDFVVAPGAKMITALVGTSASKNLFAPRTNHLVVWSDPKKKGELVNLGVEPQSLQVGSQGDLALVSNAKGEGDKYETDVLEVSLKRAGFPTRKVWKTPGWLKLDALSADGTLLAATLYETMRSGAEQLIVVDLSSGKVLWRRAVDKDDGRGTPTDGGRFTSASFSSSSRELAIGTKDGRILTFDARTGRFFGSLGAEVRRLEKALFLGPETLATVQDSDLGRSGGHVTLWSLRDGKVSGSKYVHGARDVVASANGDVWIASAGRGDPSDRCGKRGHLFSAVPWQGAVPPRDGGQPITGWKEMCLEGLSEFGDANLSLGRVVMTDEYLKGKAVMTELAVHDLRSGSRVQLEDSFTWSASGVSGEGISRDGRWVVASNVNVEKSLGIRIWNATTGKVAHPEVGIRRKDGRTQASTSAISWDGKTLAVSQAERISVRELDTGKETASVDAPVAISSLAFGPGKGDLFAGDNDGNVMLIRDGKIVHRGASDGGAIMGIDVTADGKLAATRSSDDAARVWDAGKVEVRAALAEFEDGESIAYTRAGAYAGTAEVADRVGWVFDAPLEAFDFAQFASRFSAPDRVRSRLAGQADDLAAAVQRPPRVTLSGPAVASVDGTTITLQANVASGARVDSVRVFSEGRPVAAKAVCSPSGQASLEVPLFAGPNHVSVVAFDDRGFASNAASMDVTSRAGAGARPDVWVVSIGVSKYPNLPPASQLELADDDATAIADAFRAQAGAGKSYGEAHAIVLTDEQVSRKAVQQALEGLSKMKPSDVAVVFFAGHGAKTSAGADMVFLTGAASFSRESVDKDGIGWSAIGAWLAAAHGRVLVLLDACHAGHVTQEAVVANNELFRALERDRRAGLVVFAAAKGRQFSYEGVPGDTTGTGARGLVLDAVAKRAVLAKDAHGFFTGAILNSLSTAETDRNLDGFIQLSELVDDVGRRVTRASRGRQTPWIPRRELFGDFGLAQPIPAHP